MTQTTQAPGVRLARVQLHTHQPHNASARRMRAVTQSQKPRRAVAGMVGLMSLLATACATSQPRFSAQALRAEAQVRKESGDVQRAAQLYAQLACQADMECHEDVTPNPRTALSPAEPGGASADAATKPGQAAAGFGEASAHASNAQGADSAGVAARPFTSGSPAGGSATQAVASETPAGESAGQPLASRDSGQTQSGSQNDGPADICRADPTLPSGAVASAAYARQWVDMWDAAGRTSEAWAPLRDCNKSRALDMYVASLMAGAMANWDRAEAVLDQADGVHDLGRAWRGEVALRRAMVALHRGQVSAAFEQLEAAHVAVPERTDVYLVTAQARLASRDYEDAVSALRPLLGLQPTDVELERARQIVATAVEESQPPMAPTDNAAVRDLLGLLTQETLSEADLSHALGVASGRKVPRLMTVAGLVAFKQGATDKGLQLLEVAQDQAPLDPDPPRLIGLHYVADNMPDAALGPLVEAAKRNPFDPEIQVAIAQLAAVVGDLKLARASYQNLTVLRPDVAVFQAERARLDARLKVAED